MLKQHQHPICIRDSGLGGGLFSAPEAWRAGQEEGSSAAVHFPSFTVGQGVSFFSGHDLHLLQPASSIGRRGIDAPVNLSRGAAGKRVAFWGIRSWVVGPRLTRFSPLAPRSQLRSLEACGKDL